MLAGRSRILLAVFLPLAALMVAPRPARAEDPEVRLRPGLGGYARDQRWLPIQVEVAGTDKDFKGTLVAGTREGGQPGNRTELAIEVPRGARKRFEVQVHAEGPASFWLTLLDERGRVVSDGECACTPSSSLWGVGILAPTALGLDVYRTATNRDIDIAMLLPADIPSHGWGLDAIDWLLWCEPDPQVLLPEQLEALRDWVLSGGRLCLCVAQNADLVAKSTLAELVPGRLSPPKVLESLTTLSDRYKAEFNKVARFAVAQLAPDQGEVLLAQSGMPLAVRSHFGLGEVLLLTFDPSQPAFGEWDRREKHREQMWLELLRLEMEQTTPRTQGSRVAIVNGVRYPSYPTSSSALNPSQGIARRMESAPLGEEALNPSTFVSLFLVYLVVVGVFDWVLWKAWRRPLGVWLTTPVWIGLFAVVAWSIGTKGRREPALLRSVAVYDRTEDGKKWSLWGTASLYVGSAERMTIRPAMDRGAIWPESGPQERGALARDSLKMTQTGTGLEVRDCKMHSASMLSFVYRGYGAVPEMEGLRVRREGGLLVIENGTSLRGLRGRVLGRVRKGKGKDEIKCQVIGAGSLEPGMRVSMPLEDVGTWHKATLPTEPTNEYNDEFSREYFYPFLYGPTYEFGAGSADYALSVLLDPLRDKPHWSGRPAEFVPPDLTAPCLLLTAPAGPSGLAIDPSSGEKVGAVALRIWLHEK